MLKVAVDTMVNFKIARADPKFARALFFKLAIQVISRIKFRSSYLVGTSTTKIQNTSRQKNCKEGSQESCSKEISSQETSNHGDPKEGSQEACSQETSSKEAGSQKSQEVKIRGYTFGNLINLTHFQQLICSKFGFF